MDLFDEIGGEAAISAAVEIFYHKVTDDPRVAMYFEGVDVVKLREKQVAFLSMALGGPEKYAGQSLEGAHASLGITEGHFEIVCEHLKGTLESIEVSEEVISRVIHEVYSLKYQIVTKDAQG